MTLEIATRIVRSKIAWLANNTKTKKNPKQKKTKSTTERTSLKLEKEELNALASDPSIIKTDGRRTKPNGYRKFVSLQFESGKAKSMSEVGAAWKALSEDERNTFKEAALGEYKGKE